MGPSSQSAAQLTENIPMAKRSCFLCASSFDENDFDDLIVNLPPGEDVRAARDHYDLGNHDPVCPECTESKVFARAWEFVEAQDAADRVRMAQRRV